jgi:hypothetical protein
VAKRGHGNTPHATVAKRGHDTTRHKAIRLLATKNIQNLTNRQHKMNPLHKQQQIIKQVKQKMRENNLKLTEANKGKIILTTNKHNLDNKVNQFMNKNQTEILKTTHTNNV